MRTIRQFVLTIFAALLFLAGCGIAGPLVFEHDISYVYEDADDITPLMWHVTSPDGQTMYLFGSIHVGTPDIYPLPDFVMDAFRRSDYLAVEFNEITSGAEMMAAMPLFMYTDGRLAIDDMGEELHARAVAALGDYALFLDIFMPIMWYDALLSVALDRTDLGSGGQHRLEFEYGLDLFFIRQSWRHAMPILEVESVTSQMEMLAGLSMPLQIALLEAALDDLDYSPYDTLDLFELWKQGDEDALRELLSHQGHIYTDELFAEYWDAMMTQRDIHMTQMARNYMAEGRKVFFVVGLAHFLVDNGIIDLLTQYGYDVIRVQ